jgi:hypothetical protein
MHEEESNKFLNIWPEVAPKIVEKAKTITNSPGLKKFISEEFG